MGELRHALRAFASEGHAPAEITGLVNEVLRRYHPGLMATLCLVLVQPATGKLTIVNCGHMPLLLASDAGAHYVGEGGLVLGLTRHEPHVETAFLPTGGTALLFTDGLVEDREVFLDTNLEKLRSTALEATGADVEAFANRVLAAFGPHEDDVAMIVLRRAGLGRAHRVLEGRVDRHEAADPGQLEHAAHRSGLRYRQPQLNVARGGPLVSPHYPVYS
jgi:serine phosphatase RsbU (regulator of sigma subunit)